MQRFSIFCIYNKERRNKYKTNKLLITRDNIKRGSLG